MFKSIFSFFMSLIISLCVALVLVYKFVSADFVKEFLFGLVDFGLLYGVISFVANKIMRNILTKK